MGPEAYVVFLGWADADRSERSEIANLKFELCGRSVANPAAEKNRRATPRNRSGSEKVGDHV